MQAIRTRYHGATNARGSRIVAKSEGGSIIMPYNHALNIEGNHAAAARLLLAKMNWSGVYSSGVFDRDYYWVCSGGWAPVASIDSESVAA